MATSSFEKDFIVTDKQAPLWEKALKEMENKKIELPPVNAHEMTISEIEEWWKKVKN